MSAPVPLDDLPRDLDALYAMYDALGEQIDALSDCRGEIAVRIYEIVNATEDWTAYRDCITGERRIA